MKILLLLYFALTTPSIILLSTFLYGGISQETIKNALSKEQTYDKLYQTLTFGTKDNNEDSNSAQIDELLTKRLTPNYLQQKTENYIDTAASWIAGKSATPPVISFKELKDDITAQNPELLAEIDELQQSATTEEVQEMSNEGNVLETMMKSDFTFNTETYLSSLRFIYLVGKIALPLHILILLGVLFMLWIKSNPLPNRLKWLGSTFLAASTIGYVNIFLSSFFLVGINETISQNSDYYSSIFLPLITTIVGEFLATYKHYQLIINLAFLLMGFMFLIFAFITRPTTVNVTKVNKKAK